MNLTYVVYRDDLDYLPVLASLPPQQTVFEYLVGCWKRLNSSRLALTKKVNLDHLHHLAENMKCLQLVRTGISTDGNAASIRQARDFAASHYQLYWLDTTGTRDVPSTRRASSCSSQSIYNILTSSLPGFLYTDAPSVHPNLSALFSPSRPSPPPFPPQAHQAP